MASLETSLAYLETKISEAQKITEALTKALRGLRKAASSGHLSDIEKGLAAIPSRAEQAQSSASELSAAWRFDTKTLEKGYLAELQEEAKSQGLSLVERDARLYCFPLVLRLEPRETAVRIGSKREKRLRPKEVVRQLAAIQKKKQRFNVQKFLDALYQVYRRFHGDDWRSKGNGPGPAVPLEEIHDLLTVLPGTDYPIEEFGRDLLLLARQPDLRTRDGSTFEFPGSTMTKERVKRISVYDEQGNERIFVAIRFAKGT
jgi:hypothetical protein